MVFCFYSIQSSFWYGPNLSFTLSTLIIRPTACLIFSLRAKHIHLSGTASPFISSSCWNCGATGNCGIHCFSSRVIEGEDFASKALSSRERKVWRGVVAYLSQRRGRKHFRNYGFRHGLCWRMERRRASILVSASDIYPNGFDMRPPCHTLSTSQRTRSMQPVSRSFIFWTVFKDWWPQVQAFAVDRRIVWAI